MRVSVVLSAFKPGAKPLSHCQTSLALPGCEPAAGPEHSRRKLSGKEFDRLKFTEQMAQRREVLGVDPSIPGGTSPAAHQATLVG
jgi:hypothetical protein